MNELPLGFANTFERLDVEDPISDHECIPVEPTAKNAKGPGRKHEIEDPTEIYAIEVFSFSFRA